MIGRIVSLLAAACIALVAGCASPGATPARPSQATAVAAAPTPSPVSTAATLSGTCTMGGGGRRPGRQHDPGHSCLSRAVP